MTRALFILFILKRRPITGAAEFDCNSSLPPVRLADPRGPLTSAVYHCFKNSAFSKASHSQPTAKLSYLSQLPPPFTYSYVDFLRINQKAPVDEMPETLQVTDHSAKVKQMAKTDRNFYEKGMKAFVSYVQSYTKHECRYLLRVKDLDFAGLASGFALLKIPHMPELKGADLSGFQEEKDVDLNQVGYLDAGKEERRQEKLKLWKETGENPFLKKKKAERWSEAKGKKEDKKTKRDERKEKKAQKKQQQQKRKAAGMSEDDLKDLADDIRLIKKFKKGKIGDDDFEEAFCKEEEDAE